MAGNAWEWVNDWYGEVYYQNSPGSDPTGPTSGDYCSIAVVTGALVTIFSVQRTVIRIILESGTGATAFAALAERFFGFCNFDFS